MAKIVAVLFMSLFTLTTFSCDTINDQYVYCAIDGGSKQDDAGNTTQDITTPATELVISLEVLDDLITDTSAWVVVKINKPGKYNFGLGKIEGNSYGSVEGWDGITPDPFLPQWYYSPQNPLDPDSAYLVKLYATDNDGNVAAADATFRTKSAPAPAPSN